MRRELFLWIFVSTFCVLSLAGPVAAALLPTYDLDSLASQSTDVVEAVLGVKGKADGYSATVATVTTVYKGQLMSGQRIAVGALDQYAKFNPDPRPSAEGDIESLAPGDHVFLFLVHRTGTEQPTDAFPQSRRVFWAVLSGVKIVLKGQVFGFRQLSDPGGYVTDRPEPGGATVNGFRALLVRHLKHQ